jgi:hypothetical protein
MEHCLVVGCGPVVVSGCWMVVGGRVDVKKTDFNRRILLVVG